jgi:hypothetical protein
MKPDPMLLGIARARLARSFCAAVLLCVVGVGAGASADDSERGPAPPRGDCVKVSSEARYAAYGFDHIVTLENTCDTAMRCEVTTDVNPTPTTVELAKGETKSVLTYRGSPASEFKAKADCKAQ